MRGSGGIGRGLILVLGALLVLGGLVAVSAGREAAISGVWAVVVGLVMIVVAVVERFRYRSEVAERSGLPVGPGGGEPTAQPLETRFRRTDEVFVDPTSDRRMRVWLDEATGERRYRAED
jgi:Lon protease-like protein